MKRVLELCRRQLSMGMHAIETKEYRTLKGFRLPMSYSEQSGQYPSVHSDHPVEAVALNLEAAQPW